MSPMVRQPFTIEHALLGFLHEGPGHGYGIYQELSDAEGLGLVWRLKQSQLYALLAKLEEHDYIQATIEPQEGRPPRKVFTLTKAGRAAFLEWIETPVTHGRQLRLEFLAKLYFARRYSDEAATRLVARQRRVCLHWLEEQRIQADAASGQPYEWLVHQFRVGQIEAMLAWLEVCEVRTLDGKREK